MTKLTNEEIDHGDVYMGRNTHLLHQRDARICTNLMCPNTDYMPLNTEKCPDCNKPAKPTTKQQEPPYVKCE